MLGQLWAGVNYAFAVGPGKIFLTDSNEENSMADIFDEIDEN